VSTNGHEGLRAHFVAAEAIQGQKNRRRRDGHTRRGIAQFDWLTSAMISKRFTGIHQSASRTPPAAAILALLGVGLLGVGLTVGAAPPAHAADKPREPWPAAVHARYRLSYLGVSVGQIDMTSKTAGGTYEMSGSGKVTALLGAVKWSGASNVSGTMENGAPHPTAFNNQVSNSKKSWATAIGYKNRAAPDVTLTPPPGDPPPELVPLTPVHKTGALDPLSAVMLLTQADGRPPCARRLPIFDGKQRYDLVFSFKRMTRLPSPKENGGTEVAVVCRVAYEPIAGYLANEATKTYVANRDTEVVLRRIPGTEMLIPYSVTVPTAWGTGSMTMEKIEVTTASGAKIAMRE
jgi:hypothetical protein